MQRSITGLEQSIKSVDSKLDRIEWKIETISTGTMGVGEGADFSLLKLLTSVADVKKQFEKEKENLDALKSQHENVSASLYDTIAALQNRYMNLYYKLNQDDS